VCCALLYLLLQIDAVLLASGGVLCRHMLQGLAGAGPNMLWPNIIDCLYAVVHEYLDEVRVTCWLLLLLLLLLLFNCCNMNSHIVSTTAVTLSSAPPCTLLKLIAGAGTWLLLLTSMPSPLCLVPLFVTTAVLTTSVCACTFH
jgi:hypothetical protein